LSQLAANPLCYARCREFERPALGTEEITKSTARSTRSSLTRAPSGGGP